MNHEHAFKAFVQALIDFNNKWADTTHTTVEFKVKDLREIYIQTNQHGCPMRDFLNMELAALAMSLRLDCFVGERKSLMSGHGDTYVSTLVVF